MSGFWGGVLKTAVALGVAYVIYRVVNDQYERFVHSQLWQSFLDWVGATFQALAEHRDVELGELSTITRVAGDDTARTQFVSDGVAVHESEVFSILYSDEAEHFLHHPGTNHSFDGIVQTYQHLF